MARNRPLKLTLLYNTSENHQKIQPSQWRRCGKKNLGVDVKLQNQEWKTYIDSRNTGNFDVIRASGRGLQRAVHFPVATDFHPQRKYFPL